MNSTSAGMLWFLTTPDSREESVLGSIPLPSYKILFCTPRECKNRKFTFKVSVEQKNQISDYSIFKSSTLNVLNEEAELSFSFQLFFYFCK